MKIVLSSKAERDFKKLPKVDQIALTRKTRSLTGNVESEKLKGFKNVFRVRVGDYRIVFRKTSLEVYIILIGHRKDIYRVVDRLLRS